MKAANTALNSLQELPSSVAPAGISNAGKTTSNFWGAPTSNTKNSNAGSGSGSNSTGTINSYFQSVNKTLSNTFAGNNNTATASKAPPVWAFPLLIFTILVAIFTGVFYVYNAELGTAYSNIIKSIQSVFGYNTAPATPTTNLPGSTTANAGIIERVLPVSSKEVFNISSNEYTYYDAEPLCRAMGAELATYDQVKKAWENGADWCNYGWVKGQVAVYPTQTETWNKLQGGPDEEKAACGNPGVNGGYFDNPELKFGVSCYGKKPAKSSNDERILMENGSIPRTTEMLKVDEKVNEFKNELGTIGVLPFNNKSWDQL